MRAATDTATWRGAIEGFTDHLAESNRRQSTSASYIRHVTLLRDACGTVSPWDVTREIVDAWLEDRSWSKSTRKNILVSLRAFYAWGIERELCEASPLIGISGSINRGICGPAPVKPTRLWIEPIDAYLRTLEAGGRAASTISQYRTRLIALSYVFVDPSKVTERQLMDYLARDDWSLEYKRHCRMTIMGFYRWAERVGLVAQSPARDLQTVRRVRALPRPTPSEEIFAAFDRADHRIRLAIELAAYAGLRRSEIARIRLNDVVRDQMLVRGKGGNHRVVPLHPVLVEALHGEFERRREAGETSEWLFPSPHGRHITAQHLGKLVNACFGPGWTLHTLRHRFASQAYASSRDLRAVQELLGHSRPETTAIYAAVPDGARQAAVMGVGLS